MKLLLVLSLLLVAVNAKRKDMSDAEIWKELEADFGKDEIIQNKISDEPEPADDDTKSDAHDRNARREARRRERAEKRRKEQAAACAKKKCALGKECVIDENDEPICVCAKACAPEHSDRAMVCSTKNVTFASECELHRQKCLCHREQLGCADPKFAHAHMDYYGPCVEIRPCSDFEKSEFPLRMREWLYFVMEELAHRDSLNNKATRMAKRAEEINRDEGERVTETERWMIPAVWKFCDLDETHDDLVDDAEMMPVTAPLKGMEHCIGSFMEDCDQNGDGTISKTEWIECLQLDLKLIETFEIKCDEFHD